MSSVEDAILLSSDDESAIAETPTQMSHSDTNNSRKLVRSLVDLLHIPEEKARSQLELFDLDLERTINYFLNHDSRKYPQEKQLLSKPDPEKLESSTERTSQLALSDAWNQCIKKMGAKQLSKGTRTYFVDDEFQPMPESLHGRKTQLNDGDLAGGESGDDDKKSDSYHAVKCLCGLVATAKTVQSDGPNYGRFYLACGQTTSTLKRHNTTKKEEDEKKKNDKNEKKNTPKVVNPYDKTKKNKGKSEVAEKEYPPFEKKCNFFQWDPNGTVGAAGYATRLFAGMAWQHFGVENGCCLFKKEICPDAVRQGKVGNCWFLSALAVVAEKPYLVRQMLPQTCLNEEGCYQVNLCLDGSWTPVVVDSYLPVILTEKNGSLPRNRSRSGVPSTTCSSLVAIPGFCAVPDLQLWPALVEKAYAKAHGSYAQLSGGFIAEGLTDLTGAPTETIVLRDTTNIDELWGRLMSFHQAGFLMGVATAKGGDGLVGGHAYSILDVVEVHDSMIGEQSKVTDYFSNPSKKQKMTKAEPRNERVTIRLARIRNPWGIREWKGDWSADSERWTSALRRKLGGETYTKGDGTFFMSFSDMLYRFHHMDVAKTQKGWSFTSSEGLFLGNGNPLFASKYMYRIEPKKRTWAFVSVLQRKKRANTKSKYWYIDPSFMLFKRKEDSVEWSCEKIVIAGVRRSIDCEIFLDPSFSYCCIPFSCLGCTYGTKSSDFRLTVYSSNHVDINACPHGGDLVLESVAVLHKNLLGREPKYCYPVSGTGMILAVYGMGCLYFLIVNASSDLFLSIRLSFDLPDGLLLAYGRNEDSLDTRPRSQRIVAVVCTNGKQSSATHLKFRYLAGVVKGNGGVSHQTTQPQRFGSAIDMTMSAEFLMGSIDPTKATDRGSDTIETFHWISQLGSQQ